MRISDWSSDVCSSDLTKATCRAASVSSEIRKGLFIVGRSWRREGKQSCGGQPLGRRLEGRQGALDHRVRRSEADAEMLRRREHAARHDEDVTVRQSIEEGVAVAAPRTAEEIEGTLRPDHLVAPLRQRADHAVAPPGERTEIEAERLEARHGARREGAA